MDYKDIDNRINRHYSERRLFRKEICAAIHGMAEELGGKVEVGADDDTIGICYDGGNHVEYSSTMNSRLDLVTSTVARDPFTGEQYDTFSVDCENEAGVEEFRLMFDDVTSIFDFVLAQYRRAKGTEQG